MGLRKNAPPPDDQVTGHEIVHADIADKDLDAQRGKTDAEKEADAAPGTDELNAEKKGDKKSAKKRVNEILHPTQEQQ